MMNKIKELIPGFCGVLQIIPQVGYSQNIPVFGQPGYGPDVLLRLCFEQKHFYTFSLMTFELITHHRVIGHFHRPYRLPLKSSSRGFPVLLYLDLPGGHCISQTELARTCQNLLQLVLLQIDRVLHQIHMLVHQLMQCHLCIKSYCVWLMKCHLGIRQSSVSLMNKT